MASRDMSKAQFRAALKRNGMTPAFMGYVDIGNGVSVYAGNAGDRRRTQLAYLIQRQAEQSAKAARA